MYQLIIFLPSRCVFVMNVVNTIRNPPYATLGSEYVRTSIQDGSLQLTSPNALRIANLYLCFLFVYEMLYHTVPSKEKNQI